MQAEEEAAEHQDRITGLTEQLAVQTNQLAALASAGPHTPDAHH